MTDIHQPDRTGPAPAAPPPGWYPDQAGVTRWWDGARWGPEAPAREALAPPAGAPSHAGPARAAFPWAWTVAATPLVILAAAVLAAVAGGPSGTAATYLLIGDAVAVVVSLIAALRDAAALRQAGELESRTIARWCFLSPWAYLLARAIARKRRTGADWGMLAASAAAWLVVIAISLPVVSSVITNSSVLDRAKLQSSIAQWAKSKTGETVTVNCPQDPPINPGSVFDCVMTAEDGSTALVAVTIQDTAGDVTWQVQQ